MFKNSVQGQFRFFIIQMDNWTYIDVCAWRTCCINEVFMLMCHYSLKPYDTSTDIHIVLNTLLVIWLSIMNERRIINWYYICSHYIYNVIAYCILYNQIYTQVGVRLRNWRPSQTHFFNFICIMHITIFLSFYYIFVSICV